MLLWEGMDAAQRALMHLSQQIPESPYPRTYLGELLLWQGKYEEALETLDHVWRTHHQKWSGVGSGAALMFLGRADQAERRWAELPRWTRDLEAETTWAYLGELYLQRGDHAQAITSLRRSVATRHDRVGGWLMLALAAARAGETSLANMAQAELWDRAPGLCCDAVAAVDASVDKLRETRGRSLSAEALEAGRQMLRGNRSSYVVTWYCGDDIHMMRTNLVDCLRGMFRQYHATIEQLGITEDLV